MNKNTYKNLLINSLICRGHFFFKKRGDKELFNLSRNIHKKQSSKKNGFTLLELLIVIAIIGVLSTLLMVNFIGIRQRARDGVRKSDISQIRSALEEYRADQGNYPTTIANCGNSFTSPDGSIIYMQKIPCDPLGASYYNTGSYYYYSNGTTYNISACLENVNDSQGTSTSPGGTGCSTNFYYTLSNP